MHFHFRKRLNIVVLFFRKCVFKALSFCRALISAQDCPDGGTAEEGIPWTNPYLRYSRSVIEEILKQKGMDYRAFRPILIDTDQPDQVFGEEDDVDQVLPQLERGLNFLEICTDRPDYFADWKDEMERDYGLLVRVVPKSHDVPLYGNTILDFERSATGHGGFAEELFFRMTDEVIYLPFQKREWKAGAAGQLPENAFEMDVDCLDINVPIGYNMLAVRVKRS
ncbi:MAG: hypothetical protein LUC83_10610 [Clostridiales bacterium]|nr:hypothetical protein [Clostridiales bacterium]